MGAATFDHLTRAQHAWTLPRIEQLVIGIKIVVFQRQHGVFNECFVHR